MRNLKASHACLLVSFLVISGCSDDDKKSSPAVNSAPTTSNVALTTQTEVAINDMLVADDVDGDALTYSLTSNSTLGSTVVNADGSYTYTPNKEATGADSFVFSVSDGVNEQVSASVNITIEALQVDFAQFATDAFNQGPNAEPLSVNGRVFTNADTDVDDLLSTNNN
ncbi:cadherin-like domain-containing protein [Pseudoalteromonas sp. SWXJZ94C]|uniref:Ig-like domain-containing protein n=1 Tax=unclassified Pseudoalteromonas TaxID=194690 RepID=UPI00040ADC40|nr:MULTISPECIES: Ig-like domain-containing protein [unclassified Pseudoalteromonas]MBH0056817.1 cadherin-like domain-containing protein [Pseudoalteromonas sp. SWXJZ94C]